MTALRQALTERVSLVQVCYFSAYAELEHCLKNVFVRVYVRHGVLRLVIVVVVEIFGTYTNWGV
jgi:hypothetical protein